MGANAAVRAACRWELYLNGAYRLAILTHNNKGRQPLVRHWLLAITCLHSNWTVSPALKTASQLCYSSKQRCEASRDDILSHGKYQLGIQLKLQCCAALLAPLIREGRGESRVSLGKSPTQRHQCNERTAFLYNIYQLAFRSLTLSFLTASSADGNLCSASPSTCACQPRSTIFQSACTRMPLHSHA